MFKTSFVFDYVARSGARRHSAVPCRADRTADISRCEITAKEPPERNRSRGRFAAALITLFFSNILATVSLIGVSTPALACACGCNVFDVGGLGSPQEQDHGGRVFFEFWSADQTQNYVGSSKAPAAINLDKKLNTQWYSLGFQYMFNRDWGVMARIPTATRTLTTNTQTGLGI